jgi:hypothetical protein
LGSIAPTKKFTDRKKSEWLPENWFSWEVAWACFSILSAGCIDVWRPVIRNLHAGPLKEFIAMLKGTDVAESKNSLYRQSPGRQWRRGGKMIAKLFIGFKKFHLQTLSREQSIC